jgi:hypothetical protein
LRFVSDYRADCAIFLPDQFANFTQNRSFTGYAVFDDQFGVAYVTLAAGTYYVGFRNQSSSANFCRLELDLRLTSLSGYRFNDIYVQESQYVGRNGGLLWQPFTIQSGIRYFCDGANGGLETYLIPGDQLDNFRNNRQFTYYTTYSGESTNLPGFYEINLPPGNYYLAFRNQQSIDKALTYSMERWVTTGGGTTCTYSINPGSASFNSNGGSASVSVSTSSSSCSWNVSNVPSWITINSGSSGTGNGTVSYTVAQNTSSSSRSATLTIAGQAFMVTQAAPAPICNYQISPTSQNISANGGTGSVSVTTSLGSCTWSVTNVPNWLTITSGSSGTGNGTVNYSVAANTTSASRSATLTIAGQAFTVTQAAPTGGGGTTTELAIDDGSFETAIGYSDTQTLSVVNRLTPTSYPATLSQLSLFFRTDSTLIGKPVTLLVGTNPGGGSNINGTVFQTINTVIAGTGQFFNYDVPDVTITSGDFVVGFRMTIAGFPYALDQTAPQRRSYFSTDGTTYRLNEDSTSPISGNYGIRVRLTSSGGGGGGTGFVSLSSGIGQNGTISGSTIANTCRLGDTQYMIQVPNGATQLRIDLNGNQDVDLYARFGQAITVSSGSVVADYRADSQSSSESIVITSSSSPPLQPGTYFLAVSNCGTAPGSFTITATVSLTVAPRITGATVQGKKLIVVGENFDDGALLFMDGARQKKTTNSEDSPSTTLIAAKSGKAIPRGSTVVLQVRNNDGSLSNQFLFTRQ